MKREYYLARDLNGNEKMIEANQLDFDAPLKWTEEIKAFKESRTKELEAQIKELDDEIILITAKIGKLTVSDVKDKEEQITKLITKSTALELFRDEMNMDLRENKQLLEYDGKVPKHIEERARKKCEKTYHRWRNKLGEKGFREVKEAVDITFRKKVVVDIDPTVASGGF